MTVGTLSPSALAARLQGPGLSLSLGPFRILFVLRVRPALAPFGRLYANFPIADDGCTVDSVVSCMTAADPDVPLRRAAISRIDGRFHAATRFLRNATPSLEWTLNWSIATKAHWLLIVHAAVVAEANGAVLMPGGSGSGKSTLAAALAAGGWRLFSDEFALVDPAPDRVAVLPCPRAVSLKNESIAVMRRRAPQRMLDQEFPRTGKGTVGYFLPSADDVARQHETAVPRLIVFPRWRAGSPPMLRPLNQVDALMAMIRNSVNYDLLGEVGARTMTTLVRQCPAYQFEYDDLDAACACLADTVGKGHSGHASA